jgi:hypothetical protein
MLNYLAQGFTVWFIGIIFWALFLSKQSPQSLQTISKAVWLFIATGGWGLLLIVMAVPVVGIAFLLFVFVVSFMYAVLTGYDYFCKARWW